MKFKVSTIIEKPVDVVVGALMNPDNLPYWTTDLVRFEVVSGKAGEAGAVGRLHYMQNGRSYIMEDKMIYCEPGKKYVSRVSGDVIEAQVETLLNAIGGKTEMTVTWSGKGKILLLKLFMPLLKGTMIRQSQMELDKFKRLVESKGSDFGRSQTKD